MRVANSAAVGAGGAAATSAATTRVRRASRSSVIENLPELLLGPRQLAAYRALAHAEAVGDTGNGQGLPADEEHHGALLTGQALHGGSHLFVRPGGVDPLGHGHTEFAIAAASVAPGDPAGFVDEHPGEIGPLIGNEAPSR